MTRLRRCVAECVDNLRETGIGPVDMIITIKACAKESAARYHPVGDGDPKTCVDILMEQIVSWAIVEYYTDSA